MEYIYTFAESLQKLAVLASGSMTNSNCGLPSYRVCACICTHTQAHTHTRIHANVREYPEKGYLR